MELPSTKSKRIRKVKNPIRFKAMNWRAQLKWRSKNSTVPFDMNITIDYLEKIMRETKHCPCCGVVLDLQTKPLRINASPSIDKLIPENGYVLSNISLICWRCNNLKRDSNAKELRMVADWIDKRSSEPL